MEEPRNGVVVDPVHTPENTSPRIECWKVSGDVAVVHDEGEADSNGGGGGLTSRVSREASSSLLQL